MQIKICCISSIEEANLAISAGATTIGLVGQMPSGPGIITDEEIFEIATHVLPEIATFLLTSETDFEEIYEHHQKTQTQTIQLVDVLPLGEYVELKKLLPAVNLVQVIHVEDETAIQKALDVEPFVDAILLDSGKPNATIRELGGTGRTHNWDISKDIVQRVSIPVWLAGGLDATNVRKAIDWVKPYGVDLCSGVRTNGQLNEEKLRAFMEACTMP